MLPHALPLVFPGLRDYNPGSGQTCPITWNDMKLPGVAQEIADVIGHERALYLIGQLPRCAKSDSRYPNGKAVQAMLYVPKTLRADRFLVRVLGEADAQRMIDVFGGECLKPPLCIEVYRRFRDREILAYLADGMIPHDVAALMEVQERHVRRLARDNPPVSMENADNDNAGPLQRALPA